MASFSELLKNYPEKDSGILMLISTVPALLIASLVVTAVFWYVSRFQQKNKS